MRFLIFFLILTLVSYAHPDDVHAIVILPALIVIPIVKVVALVLGMATIPSLATGIVWSKLFGLPLRKTLFFVILGLLVLGVILFVVFKLTLPDHPIF